MLLISSYFSKSTNIYIHTTNTSGMYVCNPIYLKLIAFVLEIKYTVNPFEMNVKDFFQQNTLFFTVFFFHFSLLLQFFFCSMWIFSFQIVNNKKKLFAIGNTNRKQIFPKKQKISFVSFLILDFCLYIFYVHNSPWAIW